MQFEAPTGTARGAIELYDKAQGFHTARLQTLLLETSAF